jgi:hypothetical protein
MEQAFRVSGKRPLNTSADVKTESTSGHMVLLEETIHHVYALYEAQLKRTRAIEAKLADLEAVLDEATKGDTNIEWNGKAYALIEDKSGAAAAPNV